MTLQVISSGFGRTGTESPKAALERLGYGPCNPMHAVVENPGQVKHWQMLSARKAVDHVRPRRGWDHLCAFLGKDVPDEPFPHHNPRADFWEVLGGEPA